MFSSFFRRSFDQKPRESFAHCGEDLIAEFFFQSLEIQSGFYVDIGAHHPKKLSNTHRFYLAGWKGVNIDPQEDVIQLFRKHRARDTNICAAVSGKTERRKLFVFDASSLTTACAEYAAEYQKYGHKVTSAIELETRGIVEVLNGVGRRSIDLLSIDVEGLEKEILSALFEASIHPTMIICETAFYSPRLRDVRKLKPLSDWICSMGYGLYADTFMNSVFVRKDTLKEFSLSEG